MVDTYLVQFMGKNAPCIDGLVPIKARSIHDAIKILKQMIKDNDKKIPENWDRWFFKVV